MSLSKFANSTKKNKLFLFSVEDEKYTALACQKVLIVDCITG